MQSEVRIVGAEEVVEVHAGVEVVEAVSQAELSQAAREEDPSLNSAIKAQNIQTCPLEHGQDVLCIINGAKAVIFVVNQAPALGKMLLPRDRPSNERLTSSTNKNIKMTRLTRC